VLRSMSKAEEEGRALRRLEGGGEAEGRGARSVREVRRGWLCAAGASTISHAVPYEQDELTPNEGRADAPLSASFHSLTTRTSSSYVLAGLGAPFLASSRSSSPPRAVDAALAPLALAAPAPGPLAAAALASLSSRWASAWRLAATIHG